MSDQISEKIVCRIVERKTGQAQGVYTRGNYDKYEFGSPSEARASNCHDIYEDRTKYRIAIYRVIYELIDEDAI